MTPAQTKLYWREWAAARAALVARGFDKKQADAARAELTETALGKPMSSTAFRNADLDKVLQIFRSLSKPQSLAAQMDGAKQGEKRVLTFCRFICTALQMEDSYLAGIIRQMNFERRIGQPWKEDREPGVDYADPKRNEVGLDDLNESELRKIMVALKKAARRKWPTKEALLKRIRDTVMANQLDNDAVKSAVEKALRREEIPAPDKMVYEELLVVLAVIHELACSPF